MDQKQSPSTDDSENRHLVELALRCKLLTQEQEQEILAKIARTAGTDQEVCVVRVLRDNHYLSPGDIDFLLAVHHHLKEKLLDKRFGMLAIANRLTRSSDVAKALRAQANIFLETRKNRPIGDILVANKDITRADRSAVLLTQNRIKDDSLAEAINELAVSEKSRIELNKRFGAIAVKRGYVNIQAVNQALKQQRREVKQGKNQRYLGEILSETSGLTRDEVIAVLREQRLYEKQRLNLEKALTRYPSEFKINQRLSRLFDHRVSQTKLEAFVTLKSELPEQISAQNLRNWVRLAGIRFGIMADAEISTFLSNGRINTPFLIARGIAPEQGRDGTLELMFDRDEDTVEANHESYTAPLVKKGDIIAQRTPHMKGKPGRDVFGSPIAQDRVNPCRPGKGAGVESVDDITYFATLDGHPVFFRDRTLFVTPLPLPPPLSIIKGDVEKDTGDRYKEDTLEILGNVGPGAVVRCKELRVWQHLLGRVFVSGDVDIKGNVGRKNTRMTPQKNRASIQAQGNVVVTRDIENATIFTSGKFQAQGGNIISSTLFAQRGIFLKNVCTGPGGVCILVIGRHETGRLAEIRQALGQKQALLKQFKHPEKRKEIDRLEQEISALCIEQDFLLMEQEKGFKPFSPEIKIKNKIEKGTLVKGECASLEIDRAMYGVKFHEEALSDQGKKAITVQGYFE